MRRSSRASATELSAKGAEGLERLGVEIHTSSIVDGVDRDGVTVKSEGEEERVEARTKIWAAGVQASPLARALAEASGAECDRAGRIRVLVGLHVARTP